MLFLQSFIGVLALSVQVEGNAVPHSRHSLAVRQAQQPELPTLSSCSQSCLVEGVSVSGCEPTDIACLCTSVPNANAAATCLKTNCTVVDGLESRRYSAITCNEPVRNNSDLTRRVSWIMFTLATIGVFSRMLSRLPALKGSGYGWDDWTILFCWIVLIPSDAVLHAMTDIGLGQDIWMLPDPNYQITKILRLFYVSEWTYITSVVMVKVSILLLYLRMWPEDREGTGWFRKACFTVIGLLGLFAFSCIFVMAMNCTPLTYTWTRWDGLHEGHCVNLNALIFTVAAINIIFDVATILLPIPKLWALSIPMRKKIVICITFSIGLFVTLCSIIRLRTLAVWGNAPNVTWLYNPIAIWSNTEINLGVVCACMPAVAGLVQRTYTMATGKKFSSYGRNSVTMRNGDGHFQDHDDEVRLNSFSDGSAKFNGYRAHQGDAALKGPVFVRVAPERQTSMEEKGQTMGGDPTRTTQNMINAGHSAFASYKK